MALVKQLLLSLSGGTMLFCIWIAIVVVTSQDFTHEGPNSSWCLPIDAWGQIVSDIGWAKSVSRLSPLLGTALGLVMLLSPFIIVLSVVVHLAALLLCKMKAGRKLE